MFTHLPLQSHRNVHNKQMIRLQWVLAGKDQNREQTSWSGCRVKDNKQKARGKKGVSEPRLLWDALPHAKTLQSPLWWWWWWKQFVPSRSVTCLSFGSLLGSLPLPLRTWSHPSSRSPSWVLLKRSHLPPAPARDEEGGEFHSVVSGGGGSPRGPQTVASSRWRGVAFTPDTQSATQTQPCHCFSSSQTAPNIPGGQARQSPSSLSHSDALSLCVSEFPSDLLGDISADSLVCTSCTESRAFTGRVLLLRTGATPLIYRRGWWEELRHFTPEPRRFTWKEFLKPLTQWAPMTWYLYILDLVVVTNVYFPLLPFKNFCFILFTSSAF